MKRQSLIEHIENRYGIAPEYLWAATPDYAVFRHGAGRKWFAVLVAVSAGKLGLPGQAVIDVLNVKARPEMVGALRQMPGIFSAWHMNKAHWLSLPLEGGQSAQSIQDLLDDSYLLTAKSAQKSGRLKSGKSLSDGLIPNPTKLRKETS